MLKSIGHYSRAGYVRNRGDTLRVPNDEYPHYAEVQMTILSGGGEAADWNRQCKIGASCQILKLNLARYVEMNQPILLGFLLVAATGVAQTQTSDVADFVSVDSPLLALNHVPVIDGTSAG